MPCCSENAIDGQGFHVYHFVDVGGDGTVPVLLRSRIDPYHVRKMVVKFFQIVQRRYWRFFPKLNGTVWSELFMGAHVGITDKDDPVLGRILFNAS